MVSSEPSWQYVAGFFDGEGHVGHRLDESRDTYYLQFTNTNEAVIVAIRQFLGVGRTYKDSINCKYLQNPNNHARFQLVIRPHFEVVRVATGMLPFSIVKHDELKLAIDHNSNHEYHRCKFSSEQIQRMRGLYETEMLTCSQIAKQFNIQVSTITKVLNRAGVHLRDSRSELYRMKHSERMRAKQSACNHKWNIKKKSKQCSRCQQIRTIKLTKHIDKDTLKLLYWDGNLNCRLIGKRFNVSNSAIYVRMKELGIPIRTREEAAHLRRRQCDVK